MEIQEVLNDLLDEVAPHEMDTDGDSQAKLSPSHLNSFSKPFCDDIIGDVIRCATYEENVLKLRMVSRRFKYFSRFGEKWPCTMIFSSASTSAINVHNFQSSRESEKKFNMEKLRKALLCKDDPLIYRFVAVDVDLTFARNMNSFYDLLQIVNRYPKMFSGCLLMFQADRSQIDQCKQLINTFKPAKPRTIRFCARPTVSQLGIAEIIDRRFDLDVTIAEKHQSWTCILFVLSWHLIEKVDSLYIGFSEALRLDEIQIVIRDLVTELIRKKLRLVKVRLYNVDAEVMEPFQRSRALIQPWYPETYRVGYITDVFKRAVQSEFFQYYPWFYVDCSEFNYADAQIEVTTSMPRVLVVVYPDPERDAKSHLFDVKVDKSGSGVIHLNAANDQMKVVYSPITDELNDVDVVNIRKHLDHTHAEYSLWEKEPKSPVDVGIQIKFRRY
ncbi:hypothetical protein QR680_006177 [Steinernema hermaphroditum]|uniref:Uncharacterized protein n=1 Tax=Steinernema hermaphroditum TaxID=289476 RepID=A0AA39HVY7_9BILA|nr:hypothetical protein QR680_006177 [Steinernema hermaphroditum]